MFINYRIRFEYLKLSEGFEFVAYANHQIELRCKKCGFTWWKHDDFIRRSKHGKVVCSNCGLTCKYEAPEYEKRVPKTPYVKKGHHTQAVIEAREKQTAIQRRQGEELYRQKFEALGLDFTFLKREWSRPHDQRFWVRCNKCGTEFLRDRAIFNGTLKSVHCKTCGNGTILHSDFVDEVMDFYSDKHSVKETAETFGISEWKVNEWAKRRGVTNGRTISEINREKAAVGAAKVITKTGIKFKQKMCEQGYDLVSEYRGKNTKVTLRCHKCGSQFERTIGSANHGVNCPFCIEEERKARKQELEKKKLADKLLREVEKTKREEEKNRKFDEIHLCKVCGKEYTPRQYMDSCGLKFFSNPGYCSKTCKVNLIREKGKEWRKKTKRHSSGHYSRARKLGLPREKGVTLRNLIQRNGLQCQICGMFCDPTANPKSDLYPSMDHIIPLNKGGGHVWSNVQVAHRICNSNKRDYIGKEWHNVDC